MTAAPRPLVANLPGGLALRAVWQYRGFVAGLVRREFSARYLQSVLGSAWALLTPLALIAIYTLVFANVMGARLPGTTDRFAYSIYLCAGLLPWTYFSEVLLRALSVFLDNAALLKKVSFPRSVLPVALLCSATLNFAIIFGILLLVLAGLGRFPGWAVLALLPLLALQQAFALGLGVLLGVLNVFFRDVGQLVGVLLQFWFWLTPIVYSPAVLPERARDWLAWNPLTALVGAYQDILLTGAWPAWSTFGWHVVLVAVVCGLAVFAFSRLEGELVDEL
ncbi:MAG: ABC transporter permease [Deltaproteobacteria bacterium]|nr:ABC transporter permease [Deltaproteobacteria bacterium]